MNREAQMFRDFIDDIVKQLNNFACNNGSTPSSNFSCQIPNLNILSLLKAQEIFPAIYWQDKGNIETIACFGAIESYYKIPSLKNNAKYYGGVAFHQTDIKNNYTPSKHDQWKDYDQFKFILPCLEFCQTEEKTLLTCYFNNKQKVYETITLLKKLHPPKEIIDLNAKIISRHDLPNKKKWDELVKLSINNKETSKVVLSRETSLDCQETIDPWDLIAKLQLANPLSFNFVFKFSKKYTFLGNSPERLFSRSKNALKTEALAGTIKRGDTKEEDHKLVLSFLNDQKIDRENNIVKDFIVTQLGALQAEVQLQKPYVMKLKNVQHLCVPINAQLNLRTTDKEVIKLLHPTPAVGGEPKSSALDFIETNEPYIRGWYAGAVGYLTREKSEFSVAIRSALIFDNKIKLFAGAGIVKGSVASEEWIELDQKIKTILEFLSKN